MPPPSLPAPVRHAVLFGFRRLIGRERGVASVPDPEGSIHLISPSVLSRRIDRSVVPTRLAVAKTNGARRSGPSGGIDRYNHTLSGVSVCGLRLGLCNDLRRWRWLGAGSGPAGPKNLSSIIKFRWGELHHYRRLCGSSLDLILGLHRQGSHRAEKEGDQDGGDLAGHVVAFLSGTGQAEAPSLRTGLLL